MNRAEKALADIDNTDLIRRIWCKDHTVWSPDDSEISSSLGWLDVDSQIDGLVQYLKKLESFIQSSDVRHVVLLGMGGSSLGPRVLRDLLGTNLGCTDLIVLDSILPGVVKSVTDVIDVSKTIFIVSSKSGATAETNALYKYFRSIVVDILGEKSLGQRFFAITNKDTELETISRRDLFRDIFLAPSDVGGRYSVLTYFGMVPATFIGVDVAVLLGRAAVMQRSCGPEIPLRENPGAVLGALLGSMALEGRNKLTLVTSRSLDSFGMWVEQLISESTCKDGKGIVPITGEPFVSVDCYGTDRVFVYIRYDDDENDENDSKMAKIETSGHPVIRLNLSDAYDLGAEFYRWQFATSVIGALLGINPFSQPDVELSKDRTNVALTHNFKYGMPIDFKSSQSFKMILNKSRPNDYFAIMVFCEVTDKIKILVQKLRQLLLEKYGLPTTVGYAPGFLHSTGQMHKGGPNSGLFLQLIAERSEDIAIPDEPYTFGTLTDSQAIGDLGALSDLGRRVATVRLGLDPENQVLKLIKDIG